MQKSLLYLSLILGGLFLISCGGDDPNPSEENTAEQTAIEALTGGTNINWTIANGGSVIKDNQPITAEYTEFELRLTSGMSNRNYTTTSNPLFDQSGSWSFAGANYDKIQLTGALPAAGKEISYTRTADKLRLMFTVPKPTNGKVSALAGDYVFELVKE